MRGSSSAMAVTDARACAPRFGRCATACHTASASSPRLSATSPAPIRVAAERLAAAVSSSRAASVGRRYSSQRRAAGHGSVPQIDGVRAVDPTLPGPQDDLSGFRVDQMPMLVAEVLVRQRERDLVVVEPLDLQHYSSCVRTAAWWFAVVGCWRIAGGGSLFCVGVFAQRYRDRCLDRRSGRGLL